MHANFVHRTRFAKSITRRDFWDGFLGYLAAWDAVETQLGSLSYWVGGLGECEADVSAMLKAIDLDAFDITELIGLRELPQVPVAPPSCMCAAEARPRTFQ